MTRIQIDWLRLENFKCHKCLQIDFCGQSAVIYGDNAAGKTSVYDALTWLLFGRDSSGSGEKNMEIKPLDASGTVADRDAITAVEAAFLVAGRAVTLKRTYREVWTTKRGSARETFDGNTSDYFVDGVPCRKHLFEERIRELVPEEVFRLLTSVDYFAATMPWQKRRAVLFDMAGTRTDREIMEADSRFLPLSQALGNLSLEDYRKKLTAEKKGFTGIRNETPARLNECQKTVQDLAGLDFPGARAQAAELEARQQELSAQLIALDHNAAADAKVLEIREARLELDKLTAGNDAYRARQAAAAVDLAGLERQRDGELARLRSAQMLLENVRESICLCERRIATARERWIAVNGEAFSGGACPSCGQALPFEQLRTATEHFEAGKRRRLQEIEEAAETQKEAKAAAEARARSLTEEITDRESLAGELEQQIHKAQASSVAVVDREGYAQEAAALRARIFQLEQTLTAIRSDTNQVKAELRTELEAVETKLREAQVVAAKESVLQYARRREAELRREANQAATALEAIEAQLFLTEEYTRHKARFVEDSVNSLFRTARFRLFREQANGGLEERCDVVLDGVPYGSLNSGARINVGLDIIHTLSRHFGVAVPLFVDNAESVTRLAAADTQVVRLVVSEADKELRWEYEN